MGNILEVLDAYGYRRNNPFESVFIESADVLKIGRLIKMAIQSKRMIAVVGDRGIGKTAAIEAALKGQDYNKVIIEHDEKEAVKVGHIQMAFITTLSQEGAKRNAEVRAKQLRRILGEAARQMPVVLMIEEAHRLHGQTIRSLKTLLEKDWMGVSPLFVPVLIGQYNPLSKPEVSEVRLRSDVIMMHGLSAEEAKKYISESVGKHFHPEALEATARLEPARNYLELQEAVAALMQQALQMGRRTVSVIDVYDVYQGGLREMVKITKTELSELTEQTSLSKSAVSAIVNDKKDKLTEATFRSGKGVIGDFLREKFESSKEAKTLEAVS